MPYEVSECHGVLLCRFGWPSGVRALNRGRPVVISSAWLPALQTKAEVAGSRLLHALFAKTEKAGRGAGRPNSAVVIARQARSRFPSFAGRPARIHTRSSDQHSSDDR